MDPLLQVFERGRAQSRVPMYDGRFWYNHSKHTPTFSDPMTTDDQNQIYVDQDVVEMKDEFRKQVFAPDIEPLVFERGMPLRTLPQKLKGYDFEMLVFHRLFGFPLDSGIIRSERSLLQILKSEMLVDQPRDPLIIKVYGMATKLHADTLYLLSTQYRKITLLQPAASNDRFLICLGLVNKGDEGKVALEEFQDQLSKIIAFSESKGLTSFIQDLPVAFENWLYMINTVWVGLVTEQLIHLVASKKAYDHGRFYTTGISYDLQKAVQYLLGEHIGPMVVKSDEMHRTNDLSILRERFSYHLYSDAEAADNRPLHRVINFDTDERMEYSDKKTIEPSGDHWGQRKLLLSEIDFLTHNSDPTKNTLCVYIGACPFHHGPALMEMFPNVNFWLIDCRESDIFSEQLHSYGRQGRLMISTAMYTEAWADKFVKFMSEERSSPMIDSWPEMDKTTLYSEFWNNEVSFHNNIDTLLFMSDIRTGDSETMGKQELADAITADMNLQASKLPDFAKLADAMGATFMAALKFRMPFVGVESIKYPKGILRIQPWNRLTSPEVRLWTDGRRNERYSFKEYDEIMMYHNTVVRSLHFGDTGFSGYGECHDCHLEVQILKDFITIHEKFEADMERQLLMWGVAIKDVLGPTLEMHAAKSYNATKGLRMPRKNGERIMSPLKEFYRAKAMGRLEHNFVKIMKSKTKIIDEKKLHILFKQIMYVELLLHSNERDQKSINDTERFIKMTQTMTGTVLSVQVANPVIKEYNSFAEKVSRELSDDLAKRAVPVVVKTDPKGKSKDATVRFGVEINKELQTLEVAKNFMRRILTMGDERRLGFTPERLLKEEIAVSRAYAVLRRYRNIMLKTMSQSPRKLYNSHPMLPGIECGATFLSAHRFKKSVDIPINTEYCALYEDFEFSYTNRANFLTMSMENVVIDKPVISVFPPNVPAAIELFVNKMLELISARSEQDLAILFVVPDIPEIKPLRESHFYDAANEFPFDGRVWNYRTEKQEHLGKKRIIIILKTSISTFDYAQSDTTVKK